MAFMSFDSDHTRVVELFTESASNRRDLSRAPARAAKPPRKSLLLSSLESVTNHDTARGDATPRSRAERSIPSRQRQGFTYRRRGSSQDGGAPPSGSGHGSEGSAAREEDQGGPR